MARNKGTFGAAFNFEVKMQSALDPRVVVESKSDLINKETWPFDGETIYLYEGITVAVKADKSLYMLIDITKVTAADYSGWKQLDVSAQKVVEVIDNLLSSSTVAALSANQGKVLKTEIDNISAKLAAVYSYRGSVATYEALPATGQAQGDVYNVVAKHGDAPAGTNYAWTGTEWDALGGTIDLSLYMKIADADAKYVAHKDGNIELANNKAIKGAKADGSKLNLVKVSVAGDAEIGDASAQLKLTGAGERPSYINGVTPKGDLALVTDVTAGVKTATDYADTKFAAIDLTPYVQKEAGKQLIPDAKLTLIDTNKTSIDTANQNIAANAAAIVTEKTAREKGDSDILVVVNKNVTSIEKLEAQYPFKYTAAFTAQYVTDNGNPRNINNRPFNATTNNYVIGDKYMILSVGKATEYDLYALSYIDILTSVKGSITSPVELFIGLYNEILKTATSGTTVTDALQIALDAEIVRAKAAEKTVSDNLLTVTEKVAVIEPKVTANELAIVTLNSTTDALTASVTKLNGDVSVTGSVAKTATDIAKVEAKAASDASLAWIEV